MSAADAVARLGDRGQNGDCLFRPSTRGVHMLHLTVRLAADCYLHIDVREGNKVRLPGSSAQSSSAFYVSCFVPGD